MVRSLLIALTLCAFGCSSPAESDPEALSIELRLYPTGVEADPRYTVSVVGDTVIATDSYPSLTGGRPSVRRALFAPERDSLGRLVTAVTSGRDETNEPPADAWGATLTIRGDVVYRDGDFSFESPPGEVRSLVRYMRELSGLRIELYSFA